MPVLTLLVVTTGGGENWTDGGATAAAETGTFAAVAVVLGAVGRVGSMTIIFGSAGAAFDFTTFSFFTMGFTSSIGRDGPILCFLIGSRRRTDSS